MPTKSSQIRGTRALEKGLKGLQKRSGGIYESRNNACSNITVNLLNFMPCSTSRKSPQHTKTTLLMMCALDHIQYIVLLI